MSACVTVYITVTVHDAPGANVPVPHCASTVPVRSSSTVTPVNVTLPLFVTTMS